MSKETAFTPWELARFALFIWSCGMAVAAMITATVITLAEHW